MGSKSAWFAGVNDFRMRLKLKYALTIDMNPPLTTNPAVTRWVEEMAALCQPDKVVWCDGSEEEKARLTAEAVAAGVLLKLNPQKLPGCYYHRSKVDDVARS